MKANRKVEMCGMNKGTWIGVKGVVKEDTRSGTGRGQGDPENL